MRGCIVVVVDRRGNGGPGGGCVPGDGSAPMGERPVVVGSGAGDVAPTVRVAGSPEVALHVRRVVGPVLEPDQHHQFLVHQPDHLAWDTIRDAFPLGNSDSAQCSTDSQRSTDSFEEIGDRP